MCAGLPDHGRALAIHALLAKRIITIEKEGKEYDLVVSHPDLLPVTEVAFDTAAVASLETRAPAALAAAAGAAAVVGQHQEATGVTGSGTSATEQLTAAVASAAGRPLLDAGAVGLPGDLYSDYVRRPEYQVAKRKINALRKRGKNKFLIIGDAGACCM